MNENVSNRYFIHGTLTNRCGCFNAWMCFFVLYQSSHRRRFSSSDADRARTKWFECVWMAELNKPSRGSSRRFFGSDRVRKSVDVGVLSELQTPVYTYISMHFRALQTASLSSLSTRMSSYLGLSCSAKYLQLRKVNEKSLLTETNRIQPLYSSFP